MINLHMQPAAALQAQRIAAARVKTILLILWTVVAQAHVE
jgi:hypothetical protein